MTFIRRAFPLVALLCVALVAGCDSSSDDGFQIEDYLGTYTGMVKTTARSGNMSTETTAPISVRVSQGSSAGKAIVTLDVGPSKPGDEDPEPIVLEGTYDDSGAQLRFPDAASTIAVRVDPNGKISGSGTAPFFDTVIDVRANGTATSRQFNLTLEATVTEGNEEVPVGSKITIAISTTRA